MTQENHMEHYDPPGNRIGMWVFLITEAMLFGVLFLTFAVYLHQYRYEFMTCAAELNKLLGGLNTVILLTSSLTMALAIVAVQAGNSKKGLQWMATTLLLAAGFLVVKSFEWGGKFSHGTYPESELMLQRPNGEQLYYGLYFTMTGLHAVHVIVGGILILLVMRGVKQNKVTPKRFSFIENVGLYWHLVDMVWIFLFPMFYLIGRH